MLCASAPLPEPGPISCGQVLIVNFVLFESLLAELFRRHGKPPVARRRDVEEQAASAQTTDLVEDAPKASERAVGLRFCSLKSHCRLWPLPLLVQGEQLQKTALENEAPVKTANRCVRQTRRQKHGKAPLHSAGSGRSPTTTNIGHR